MRKKLKNTSGLTMVEMLCATVILVLLCLMMGTGMQMALSSYRSLTGEAELQLMLNSLTDALSDKLRYCVVTKTKKTDGSTGYSYSYSIGEVAVTVADDTKPADVPPGMVLVDGVSAGMVLVNGKKLLPEGAYGEKNADGKNRRYQVETLTKPDPDCSGSVPVFTVTIKVKDTQTAISKETTLAVRCLNPVKKEGISS